MLIRRQDGEWTVFVEVGLAAGIGRQRPRPRPRAKVPLDGEQVLAVDDHDSALFASSLRCSTNSSISDVVTPPKLDPHALHPVTHGVRAAARLYARAAKSIDAAHVDAPDIDGAEMKEAEKT